MFEPVFIVDSLQVWPKGKVVFPDFFLPRTEDVWRQLIVKHRTVLAFDGLWIVRINLSGFLALSDDSFSDQVLKNRGI